MARIYLGLALFAILLLTLNLVLGFVLGDFGRSSTAFQQARESLEQMERSAGVSRDQYETERKRVTEVGHELVRQRERFWPHIWLGIVASLISLLVNSISITYFVGTTRWCREVTEAYGMDESWARQSQSLKRSSFPWSFVGILFTLTIAGMGAASDPYSSVANPGNWVTLHWSLAMIGFVVISCSFIAQVGYVGRNYEIIRLVVSEADRIRRERAAQHPETSHVTP